MKNKAYTKKQLIAWINDKVAIFGAQSFLAKLLKISPQTLNYVLMGRIDPPPRLLKALKMKREYVYFYEGGVNNERLITRSAN